MWWQATRRQPTRRSGTRTLAVLAVGALLGASCSEDRTSDAGAEPPSVEAVACQDDLLACAEGTSLADLLPDEPTEATGEPIRLGMVNQENTPVASFPELSMATQTAIDFINDQLGGVDGRPIELEVCNSEFSPEGSTSCAQGFVEDGVPAVLGGIDVFGTAIDTLAENDVPYVGGIPVSTQSVTSPNSYQWSGGTWGATIAFADHAAREGAERAAIIYGDFGSIADSAEYGRRTLEKLGVDEVQLVPYPITAADLSAPIQAAAANDPDAVFLLAADTACKPAFDAVQTAGITGTVYFVGACAVPKIIEEAGTEKTDGHLFNVEGPIDREDPDPDAELYTAVVAEYGDGLDPIGAGTVTFRSMMNLYRVLREVGGDDVTPASITAALEAQREAPSFMGHDSTCDHEQLAGLPALCSPQQILARMEGGELTQVGTWIDVGAVYGDA